MLLSFLALLADGQQQQGQAPWWYNLLPIVFFIFMMYLIFVRPAQRQERERQLMISNVKKNDKVLLTAGIYGTVVSVAEKEDEVVVKVDDNTRLKVTKGSIMRNLSGEEALRAAAQAAAGQPAKAEDKADAAIKKAPEQGVKGK
jgi:preprotein translocase subunit YajC